MFPHFPKLTHGVSFKFSSKFCRNVVSYFRNVVRYFRSVVSYYFIVVK